MNSHQRRKARREHERFRRACEANPEFRLMLELEATLVTAGIIPAGLPPRPGKGLRDLRERLGVEG